MKQQLLLSKNQSIKHIQTLYLRQVGPKSTQHKFPTLSKDKLQANENDINMSWSGLQEDTQRQQPLLLQQEPVNTQQQPVMFATAKQQRQCSLLEEEQVTDDAMQQKFTEDHYIFHLSRTPNAINNHWQKAMKKRVENYLDSVSMSKSIEEWPNDETASNL